MTALRKPTTKPRTTGPTKTTGQMKAIWGLARQNNLDSHDLHLFVQNKTGKTSLKLLTLDEANDIIEGLGGTPQAPAFPSKRTRQKWNQDAGIERPITKEQAKYLNRLASYRGWGGEQLHEFCQRQIGRPFPTTTRQANSCIEALKSWNRRENKKI